MQYMMIIKSNAVAEKREPDDAGFLAIERYNQRLQDAGIWVGAEGFLPSDQGAIVTLENGEYRVEKGPFPNPETINAGYWIIEVESKNQALEWAMQVPVLGSDTSHSSDHGEVVLIPYMEFPDEEPPADMPAAGAAMPNTNGDKRFIGMFLASPETEQGVVPDPSIFDAMGQVIGRLAAEGRFEDGGGLMPTSAATRLVYNGGALLVTDGPFAETKEVIAGYAIFRARTLDDMIDMSREGMEIEARWRKGPIVAEIRELG